MKKIIVVSFLPAIVLFACKKSGTDSLVTLTASSTTAVVGQTVSVTANTGTNALSWTTTPATSVTKTYSVTTEKTNYFTFSQPGNYIIGVRARPLELDSMHICNPLDSAGHHIQDSLWNHHVDSLWHRHGDHLGGCKNGVDSASIIIKVK